MYKVLLPVLVSATIAPGQPFVGSRVVIATVCEVLAEATRYAGSAVAIVGRMEHSVDLIDHYDFLSQDQCSRPVMTHGHVRSDEIQVWTVSEEGMPTPPTDKPVLEHAWIAAKLALVRKTTKLGTHKEPRLDARGRPFTATVPNDWAVVYGRVVRSPILDKDCGRGLRWTQRTAHNSGGAGPVRLLNADGTPAAKRH